MKRLQEKSLEILETFVQEFLPPRGNKRKNSGNELDYITTTLDKVIKQQFGFNINRIDVIDVFHRLGYSIFEREGNIDHDKKTFIPASNGNVKQKWLGSPFKPESPFTYIDISADTVRYLMKTTSTLSEKTNMAKSDKTQQLRNKILKFRTKHNCSNDFI